MACHTRCACILALKCLILPVHTLSLSSRVAVLSRGTSASPNATASD